jgi:hypothetical protein
MQAVIDAADDAALIAAWHQPVRPDTGNVTAFVDGTRYGGDPRNVLLGDHTHVQLDAGGPLVRPQPY